MKYFLAILFIANYSYASLKPSGDICSYNLFRWNAAKKVLVGPQRIIKKRSEISQIEKGMLGCSVCEEDQVNIKLSNGVAFKACKKIAFKVENVLNDAIANGFIIESVEGYLPKMTRGMLDKNSFRTMFSHHAYGEAIDINRNHNGLYDNCNEFSSKCKLSHGGHWSRKNKLSLQANSKLVKELDAIKLNWGGEILGSQKDFMHFSPTGY